MKSFAKKVFRTLGYELRRSNPQSSETAQLIKMLSAHDINLVLDVGANEGQFGRKYLRDSGYTRQIISFEPTLDAWGKLINESKNDSNWTVAPRMAIGNFDGEIEIHLSKNSVSSSILNMLDKHKLSAPGSDYSGSETVVIKKLDSIASEYISGDDNVFLKVDTQGYEDQVLKGSESLLKTIKGLQLELSLVPLYKDQILYKDIISFIESQGFNLWSISPAFVDPVDGRLLQVDATFFR